MLCVRKIAQGRRICIRFLWNFRKEKDAPVFLANSDLKIPCLWQITMQNKAEVYSGITCNNTHKNYVFQSEDTTSHKDFTSWRRNEANTNMLCSMIHCMPQTKQQNKTNINLIAQYLLIIQSPPAADMHIKLVTFSAWIVPLRSVKGEVDSNDILLHYCFTRWKIL